MTAEQQLLEEVKALRKDLRMAEMKRGWDERSKFLKKQQAFRRRVGRNPLPGEDLEPYVGKIRF